MKFLLDTNAWIWFVDSPEKLPKKVREIGRDGANYPLGLSAISVWELARKVSLGKLKLSEPLSQWVNRAASLPFIEIVPLTPEIAIESNQLPGDFHKDPADQIITATTRLRRVTLLTADQRLLNYPHVKTLWK